MSVLEGEKSEGEGERIYRPQNQKKLGPTEENTGINNQEGSVGVGKTVGESIRTIYNDNHVWDCDKETKYLYVRHNIDFKNAWGYKHQNPNLPPENSQWN